MSHARIRKLFSDALLTYAEPTDIPVYLDNVTKCVRKKRIETDPAEQKPDEYIATHLIPADTFSDTLSGDHTGYIGMFQMTIVTKYGTGCTRAEDIIDGLQDTFKINKVYTADNGFTVQVTSPIKTNDGQQKGIQWVQHAYFEYRSDKYTELDLLQPLT
jgi:hypothetical protein